MPCLLVKDRALVKTIKFRDPTYVGDPVNAVRIFNELEVDELVFLDISATPSGLRPPFKLLEEIATECFMPLAYGGGIDCVEDAKTIFGSGFEKVVLGRAAFSTPKLISEISERFGTQSVVVSVDVRQRGDGAYEVYVNGGRDRTGLDPVSYARKVEALGAGEILLYAIDRDGTHSGYDLALIQQVSSSVSIPVVACGGARGVNDFREAVRDGGASACAAGSMVVHYGPHRAVLINFPDLAEIDAALTPPANAPH